MPSAVAGGGSRDATAKAGGDRAVRRWLGAVALATAALWVAGDETVGFRDVAALDFAPAPRERTLDASGGTRTALLDAPVPGAARAALDAGSAVYALVTAGVAARAPHPAHAHARPALIVLEARRGDERVAGRVFSVLERGARRTHGRALVVVPPDARTLGLRYLARAGTHAFDAGPVRLLVRRRAYPAIAASLGALWLALGAGLALRAARRLDAPRALACLVALGVIVVGVGLSESAPWPGRAWLAHALEPVPGLAAVGLRGAFKGGHLVAFALAGVAAGAARRRLGASVAETVAFLALAACASEAFQRHLVDRSASLSDVGIDLAGGLAGLLLVETARRVRAARRRARDP